MNREAHKTILPILEVALALSTAVLLAALLALPITLRASPESGLEFPLRPPGPRLP